jgi:hypothetical protein
MHKFTTTLVVFLTLVLSAFTAPCEAASYSNSHTAHVKQHTGSAPHTLFPAWKARASSRIAKLATRLEKLFPPRRDGDGGDVSGLAIASLCCAIGAFILVPVLGSIAGVILGIMALNKIRETGQRGKGMAIAGIIVGGIGLLFVIGYIVLVLALL